MYTVKFYYGDYFYRQKEANNDNAIVYLEQHFNADYKGIGNYSCAVVAANASETSKKFAKMYTERVKDVFNLPNSRVFVVPKNGRGGRNIWYTAMPAVLLEPLFVSNKEHVSMLLNDNGIEKLADILVSVIRDIFHTGGLVAFSVGHKYKRTKPHDRGASVYGRPEFNEADLAEWVLWKAKCKLEG